MSESGLVGYATTFHGMFGEPEDGTPRVEEVEVPLIQRDYAQGREDPRSDAIRARFLDALHSGLTTDSPVGLDFIYGDVRDDGPDGRRRFEPLDGQQRLTTLFLLHWYVAFRRGDLADSHPWTSFTYATRPSARLFCERIVKYPPPRDLVDRPSVWITDQSWYLHLWRFDPTIRAMLVTIDAIAERFAGDDVDLLWKRLTDDARPAVWFQLLPIDDMGTPESLYIKMNSRGKPLTEFEAFKAHLGQLVAEIGGDDDFGHKIDGRWTDLLWPYRGDNEVVDDEFMRYFDFLIEVCEWREARVRDQEHLTPEQRISALLSPTNPRHREHLDFICAAFDTWVGDVPVADVLAGFFKTSFDGDGVRLVGAPSTDLFQACCERYGASRGATRLFSLTDTLLLLAVITHRIEGTPDAPARLRTLRNVNEASQFEMRVQNMPKFVVEIAVFIRTGDLNALATFNQNQVADEHAKGALRLNQPDLAPALARLEDHTVLRGTLAAFDLDSAVATRAAAFEAAFDPKLWPVLTGALLATGDYQRDYPHSDMHRFGSPTTESVWRLLLVDRGDRVALGRVRTVLGTLLDRVAASEDDTRSALESVSRQFVDERRSTEHLDWRYYLVRYPTMREGNSGIYYGAEGRIAYQLTMLRKTVQRSWYRDAYLYAMWCEAGRPDEVKDPWFYGYSTDPRWMELVRSGTGLRSVTKGIAVRAPVTPTAAATLEGLPEQTGLVETDQGLLLAIRQTPHGDEDVDAVDRVQAGAQLVRALINAGL
jgi:hypothetical protein